MRNPNHGLIRNSRLVVKQPTNGCGEVWRQGLRKDSGADS